LEGGNWVGVRGAEDRVSKSVVFHLDSEITIQQSKKSIIEAIAMANLENE
jgi:hypothetical protein